MTYNAAEQCFTRGIQLFINLAFINLAFYKSGFLKINHRYIIDIAIDLSMTGNLLATFENSFRAREARLQKPDKKLHLSGGEMRYVVFAASHIIVVYYPKKINNERELFVFVLRFFL